MPQSDIMDQFYSIMVRQAMEQDSLESTKCIAQEVKSTSEAEVNVIPIVYKKGAAILRMLHVYLGDGPFMNGFRFYLKKFAYKNVDKEDLWSCIRYLRLSIILLFKFNVTNLPSMIVIVGYRQHYNKHLYQSSP